MQGEQHKSVVLLIGAHNDQTAGSALISHKDVQHVWSSVRGKKYELTGRAQRTNASHYERLRMVVLYQNH